MTLLSFIATQLILALSLTLVSAIVLNAQSLNQSSLKGSLVMAIPQQGRVRAPELEGGRGWLNTDKPLSLAALKGKVVLLDFWTYGCVNCMHIIPDLNLVLEREKVGDLPLAFPGKVLADEKNDRLFISDSNHNRIVVTRLDGTLIETIGTGAHGAEDGDYNRASFNRPQGLALDGD